MKFLGLSPVTGRMVMVFLTVITVIIIIMSVPAVMW